MWPPKALLKIATAPMGDAASRGWGPGYPHCQSDKIVTLSFASGLRIPVRREIATLTSWLINETERRGYHCHPGWCWGYACRAIRGYPGVPSNHSWGLAVDINAPTNPMKQRPIVTDMPAWMPELWKSHGFAWGGDYASRVDAMHYEVLVTPADVARITAGLGTVTNPSPVVAVLDHTLHVGDKGPIVKHVQDLLSWYAGKYHEPDVAGGSSDGTYGPRTAAGVLAFKKHIFALETAFRSHLTFRKPLDNTTGAVTLGALEFWAAA